MMTHHDNFLTFFDKTYCDKHLYPYSVEQTKFAPAAGSPPGHLNLTSDPAQMQPAQDATQHQIDTFIETDGTMSSTTTTTHSNATNPALSVVTRSFWSLDVTPLPSVLLTRPAEKDTFTASLHSMMSSLWSKYISSSEVKSRMDADEKEAMTKVVLSNALHTPDPYGSSFLSICKRVTNVLLPLPFSKPVLPDTENQLNMMPHPLDYHYESKSSLREFFSKFPDYYNYNRAISNGLLTDDEIAQEHEFDHKMKGENTSLVRVAGVTSQTMFQFVLATSLLSLPVYLTTFEYYHQKNLGYLTHSFGLPNVSEVGTPGMLTSTHAKTSIPPWLLTKGMQHNSKRLFGLYNSLAAISSTTRQVLNILKNTLNPIPPTESAVTATPEGISRAFGVPKQFFSGGGRVMLSGSMVLKFFIPLIAMLHIAHTQFDTILGHVRKASNPAFPDGRNGVTTDALLLNNSNLVFFDKQSAHNIKLKSHLELEKRRQKEKLTEKKNKDDIAKFGPQQAVKRLFDNALKRSKQQAKQEDVKKREEEFEAKLDENGELKLTRKQILIKWWTYCKNVVQNVLYIEPKSCEKKFSLTIHNTQSAITSHGLMLVLLQEHLRKQFIQQMQDHYDEKAKKEEVEEEEEEAKKKSAEEASAQEEPTPSTTTTTTSTTTTTTPLKEKKKIEDDPQYPKQPTKPPHFRYTHVLQKSNTFMLLDQQDIHNEFEYVYHILHKRYTKKVEDSVQAAEFNLNKASDAVLETINQITAAPSDVTVAPIEPSRSTITLTDVIATPDAVTTPGVETTATPEKPQPDKVVFGGVKKSQTAATLAAAAPLGVNTEARVYTGIPMYYVTSPL